MGMGKEPHLKYSAKESYQNGSSIEKYEKERFSGVFGKYLYAREQKAVSALVEMLPNGISILDCPCGNGRWWPVLARRAKHIIAVDVSQGMLDHAAKQSHPFEIKIETRKEDAEDLSLADNSVDYVFSHALTKHLPIPVQYKVLAEFSRVAREGVICSFGVFTHLTYAFWRRRHLRESYPTFPEELNWMAEAAGLKIQTMRRCTTPLGVEHTVLFQKSAV
jgi:ubiquinone/menaquinone biosynthesis C-methylase UbiE